MTTLETTAPARRRPRNGVPTADLFRCTTPVAPRGLTVPASADRQAIDAALTAVRDWAATRDVELDEGPLFTLIAALYQGHIVPLRQQADQARQALELAEAELAQRREAERAARVRREMAAERRDKTLRALVRGRDRDLCRYCGTGAAGPAGVLDHIVPDMVMGEDNLVLACRACHRRKRGRTPVEAGMVLLPAPLAPVEAELVESAAADSADATADDLITIVDPLTGGRLMALPRAEAVAWARRILARCGAAPVDEPRCPSCGEPERLLASGAVGHSGDGLGNDCAPEAAVSAR